MTFQIDRMDVLLKGYHHLLEDETSPCFSDFIEVSECLMEGYARFVRLGVPGQTVAPAMLGATMNIYEMCGLLHELPPVLRNLADRIEHDSAAH